MQIFRTANSVLWCLYKSKMMALWQSVWTVGDETKQCFNLHNIVLLFYYIHTNCFINFDFPPHFPLPFRHPFSVNPSTTNRAESWSQTFVEPVVGTVGAANRSTASSIWSCQMTQITHPWCIKRTYGSETMSSPEFPSSPTRVPIARAFEQTNTCQP